MPGFSLNVAGFYNPGVGYAAMEFIRAAGLAAQACRLLAPGAPRYEIGLTGLDDLLACAGLTYDSRASRDGCRSRRPSSWRWTIPAPRPR